MTIQVNLFNSMKHHVVLQRMTKALHYVMGLYITRRLFRSPRYQSIDKAKNIRSLL